MRSSNQFFGILCTNTKENWTLFVSELPALNLEQVCIRFLGAVLAGLWQSQFTSCWMKISLAAHFCCRLCPTFQCSQQVLSSLLILIVFSWFFFIRTLTQEICLTWAEYHRETCFELFWYLCAPSQNSKDFRARLGFNFAHMKRALF